MVGLFIFGTGVVRAEVTIDDNSNILLNEFKINEEGLGTALESEGQQNIALTAANLASAQKISLATSTGGYLGLVSMDTYLKIPVAQRKGMMQYAVSAMADSFNYRTENIPAVYAEMFLPKAVTQSTVYAAIKCSDPGSAAGLVGLNVFSMTPDCTSAWTYWQNFGIARLWGGSFAMAMMLVIGILIISGFMIMFRSKAGGQTVVTVSMALQNVLFGALMALASFALGVFFVNLSKYLTLLIANIIIAVLWKPMIPPGVEAVVTGLFSVLGLADDLTGDILGGMFLTFPTTPTAVFSKFFVYMLIGDAATIGSSVAGAFLDFINPFTTLKTVITGLGWVFSGNALVQTAVFLIAFIVMVGALLIVSIRIFWAVLQIYIKMLVDVVVAPLIFIIGALPGQQSSISSWLKRMFANSLKPGLMFGLISIAAFLTFTAVINKIQAMIPFIGDDTSVLTAVTGGFIPSVPNSGFISADSLLAAVGPQNILMIVLLNMVPTIPQVVDDMFAGKGSGAMGKGFETVKKSLGSIPLVGGMVQ